MLSNISPYPSKKVVDGLHDEEMSNMKRNLYLWTYSWPGWSKVRIFVNASQETIFTSLCRLRFRKKNLKKIYMTKILHMFSLNRPSGPIQSISQFVRVSVCPCVRVSVCPCVCSLLRYRLTVFLPPLPKVGCPICLEIRNPWGKVIERSGLSTLLASCDYDISRRLQKVSLQYSGSTSLHLLDEHI